MLRFRVFWAEKFVNEGFLYRTNEFLIQCVFFALMVAATEVGYRLGRKVEARVPEKTKSQVSTVEAAILGVGRIATRPWVVDNAVVPRSVVELSLVFDHRVADGGVAGGFIRHLADLIENPDEAMNDD